MENEGTTDLHEDVVLSITKSGKPSCVLRTANIVVTWRTVRSSIHESDSYDSVGSHQRKTSIADGEK